SLVHVLPVLFPGAELFKALEEGAHPIANWGGSAAAVELSAAETMLHRAISISFYGSLGLIIVGTGFFKSSIGSLISELYKDESDSERDAAFTIEYFVINIGAFAAPITAGVIGEVYGWHYGFLVAAIGMAVGLAIFLIAARTRIPKELKGRSVRERKASVSLGNGDAALRQSLALGAMLVLILSAYWTMFEQWGGLINLFTDEKIDRQFFGSEIPTSSLQAVNPLFIILLAPLLVKLGTWLDHSKTITVEVSPFHKLAIANILLAVTFVLLFAASAFATNSDTGRAALGWLIAAYFFMALSELLIAPVALSLFTRIAPAAMVSIAVGVFYATASIGAFLSGFVGALAENYGDGTVFAAIAVVGAILSATTLVVGRYYSVGDAQREQS
ncbi:MAG: MFS transporter, partial [Pseudomonadota bacterium]